MDGGYKVMVRIFLKCSLFALACSLISNAHADELYSYLHKLYPDDRVYTRLSHCFSAFPSESLVDLDAAQKLFVIGAEGYNLWDTLFSQSKTQAGRAVSKRLLLSPTSDAMLLGKRQRAIEWLKEHPEAQDTIAYQLQSAATVESQLLDLWNDQAEYYRQEIEALSMPLLLRSHNESPKALGLYQWFSRLKNIAYPVVSNLLFRGSLEGFLSYLEKKEDNLVQGMYKNIKNRFVEFGTTYTSLFNPSRIKADFSEAQQKLGFWRGTLLKLINTTNDGIIVYHTYLRDRLGERSTWYVLDHVKYNMVALFMFLSHIQQLSDYCKNTQVLSDNLATWTRAHAILEDAGTQRFIELIKQISERSFTTKVLEKGYIMAAYTTLQRIKHIFVPLLEFIGELDTFSVAARLLCNAQKNPLKPYTLASLEQRDGAYLALTDFHNPLVAQNQAVNSMIIGSKGHHMLLEGPHASGKSTLTRALAYNFVLIHTFGIAAARACTSTVFDKFISYANISEVPQRHLSGFDAQLHEMVTLKRTITDYEQQQKRIFCFLDEPLTGTMEEAGARELRDFCSFIGGTYYACCIVATHFNNVTAGAHFKAHHMECDEKDTLGTFVRTYQLKQGKHPWWYTDIGKRERYIDWMRRQALTHVLEKADGLELEGNFKD
jgi:hypothetical protein